MSLADGAAWERDEEGGWVVPTSQFNQMVADLAKVEQDRDRWRRALADCTPGGSEFADDPDFCKSYVKNVRSTQFEDIKRLILENQKFRKVLEDSIAALRMVRNGTEGPEIRTLARDIVKQLEEFHVGRKAAPAQSRPIEPLNNIARQERS
jgi:hypothetical protein